MRDDMLVLIKTVLHFDGSLDDMRVNVTDGSVIDAIHDDGTALHWCARGYASRCGFTPLCGLGSLGLLRTLGVNQREGRQQRQQTDPDLSDGSNIGKSHDYLPSFLCAWFSLLISATLIFAAPVGGSKLNTKSGSLV